MARVYLSLGSNVGDRIANLRLAIVELEKLGEISKTSSFYETEPMEFAAQDWFVNAVVEVETELTAQELITAILEIEQKMGRHRQLPKGPRNIDLDILFYGKQVIDEPGLTVPHPAMQRRRFVLAPLAEIAPDAIHPVFMRSASEMLRALAEHAGEVRRLEGTGK